LLSDLLLLVLILYALEALLLSTHALRSIFGLFPVCFLICILVFFMMLTDPLQVFVQGPLGLRLHVNSMTLFPTALFGVLLVFITEGRRPTWILVGCLWGVYALVLAASAMVHLWLIWPGLEMQFMPQAELFVIDVWAQLQSALAFTLDVAVLTGLFHLLARRFPQAPLWGVVCISFIAALVCDGIVYPLLGFSDPMEIIHNLPGHSVGKLVVAILMSLPLVYHLRRFSPQWLQEEIGGAEHFDLFQASGDLRRSLQISERRTRQIIDQALSVMIGFNRRGRVILWNHAAERAYGLSADEAQGRPVAEFLCDGSVEQLKQINRIVEDVFQGKTFSGELPITFERHGERRHLVGNQFPVRGVDGEVLLGVATLHDVTAVVEAERALERTTEHLEHVVDSIREGMVVVDHSEVIQLWNRAAARLTEVPAERVLGRKLREALPDFLGAPSPMGAIEHSLRSGQDDVLEHIAGPGAGSRVYEVRLHPFSDGVTIFFGEIMLKR
jgi:PAS domain S-box-containing protein